MCPLTAVQSLLAAFLSGEFATLTETLKTTSTVRQSMSLVLLNGLLAFAQNFSSLHINKIAGALTMTMCANLKQAFTVVLAVNLFENHVGYFFVFGIVVVLVSAG